jgi:hypothetical protein
MYRIKCNREQPCQNCTARGEQTACKWRGSKIPAVAVLTVDPMQQRINRLESIVKSLMSQNQQHTPPEDKNTRPDQLLSGGVEAVTNGVNTPSWPVHTGVTVIDGLHSVYKASDNWGDVLQEVTKSLLRLHAVFPTRQKAHGLRSIFCSVSKCLTR